jgi:hypothetical protein
MSKKIILILGLSSLFAAIIGTVAYFLFIKKHVELELTALDKTYQTGQQITLGAVLATNSFRAIQSLVNGRVIGESTDHVLQTYFPTLERGKEQKFEFLYTIPSAMSPGQYRLLIRVMNYGDTADIEDIISAERSFTVVSKRIPTAKEVATAKAVKAGKGIPLDADLTLYPIEASGSLYGRIIPLAGTFQNITYWDGDFKIVVSIIEPNGTKKDFSKSIRVGSGQRADFTFDFMVSPDMPEGRYAVTARLFDDRKKESRYGTMMNETVSSFSVFDQKPQLQLDQIELSIPAHTFYEFKVNATDDKGVAQVFFITEIERKGVVKNIVQLKKAKQHARMPMTLLSGDALNGVWSCSLPMPSEGSKFLFSVEAVDSKQQKVVTDQYPVSVTKEVKKKKVPAEEQIPQTPVDALPGFQGYDWQ